ncbi:Uncharacterised protein [Mycobacterium tuberculosis]|nr:Uncharacterised protein [Mycobacterium tuberculosis]
MKPFAGSHSTPNFAASSRKTSSVTMFAKPLR